MSATFMKPQGPSNTVKAKISPIVQTLSRPEAEFLAACFYASRGSSGDNFATAFQKAITPVGCGTRDGGTVQEMTYPAKQVADLAIEAGLVKENGGTVGPMLRKVNDSGIIA